MAGALVDNAAETPELAETLWRRYRALVDRETDGSKSPGVACCASQVRGAMYLLAVNWIARLIDQVEREHDPCRRSILIDILTAGERARAGTGQGA